MSEKRRDKKNRVLRNGESQRKDGRYRFTYVDNKGVTKDVYSWRLDHNDPTPKGKKREIPLREKEKQIMQDLFNQVSSNGGGYTVLSLAEKYTSLKIGVRHSTKQGYKTVLNILREDPFGCKRIDTVKTSDAKEWLIKLQQVDGRSYSSIHTIRGVLRPAFQMAENDDIIRKNPFQFELATVIVNDSVTRESITRKEERLFLDFIKNNNCYKKYYEAMYILFNTGLRISEFCGLTISDINFKEGYIDITKQLVRTSDMEYIIQPPKTEKGIRRVPMSKEVANCFRAIIENRIHPKKEPNIKGFDKFLYLDRNNMPTVAMHWEKYIKHMWERYNSIYKVQLPLITPHVCRHTFCSKMAKSGMNPKILQYIMGHSDISVTLNTYTHVDFNDATEEIERLKNNGKSL